MSKPNLISSQPLNQCDNRKKKLSSEEMQKIIRDSYSNRSTINEKQQQSTSIKFKRPVFKKRRLTEPNDEQSSGNISSRKESNDDISQLSFGFQDEDGGFE